VLISWDDAVTLFHEFLGTRCTGCCRKFAIPSSRAPAPSGISSSFPSQLLERWLITPEVLNQFAVHYQSGKPIPAELVAKMSGGGKLQPGSIPSSTCFSAI
jgi:peptidyl-dipeptidase Dcp